MDIQKQYPLGVQVTGVFKDIPFQATVIAYQPACSDQGECLDIDVIKPHPELPVGYLQAMKWAVRMEEADIDSEKTVAQLREEYEKELERSTREHWEAFEQQLASLQIQTDVLPAQLSQASGDLKTAMSNYDVATRSFTTTLVEDLHEQEFTYTQMRAAVLSALKAMFSCVWMINPHSTLGEELRHCSREAFQAAAVRCYKLEHNN